MARQLSTYAKNKIEIQEQLALMLQWVKHIDPVQAQQENLIEQFESTIQKIWNNKRSKRENVALKLQSIIVDIQHTVLKYKLENIIHSLLDFPEKDPDIERIKIMQKIAMAKSSVLENPTRRYYINLITAYSEAMLAELKRKPDDYCVFLAEIKKMQAMIRENIAKIKNNHQAKNTVLNLVEYRSMLQ